MTSVEQPTVSIVVPAYNHGQYVREAIDSVLSQDYPAIELIVLDDGSRDDTREVLAQFGDRFHWETHPNMGQAATLTKGWALARGDVLGYLSADDRLEPGAVSEAVEVLASRPDAVATYCDFNLIDPESRVVRRVETPEFSYRDMLVNVHCPLGPGAFFRRRAYETAGPWDPALRRMPDYDFWLRLGLFGTFVRIPKVLAAFRVHETSQSYAPTSPERAAEPIVIVSRVFENPALPPDLRPLASRGIAYAHLVSAQLHLRSGRLSDGAANVARAFRLAPGTALSPRSLRLLANAAFNRAGHRLLWRLKSLFRGRPGS